MRYLHANGFDTPFFVDTGSYTSCVILGGILSDAQTFFFSAWWIVIFPGVVLMLIVLSVNIIGDFLRDYFDPQLIQ